MNRIRKVMSVLKRNVRLMSLLSQNMPEKTLQLLQLSITTRRWTQKPRSMKLNLKNASALRLCQSHRNENHGNTHVAKQTTIRSMVLHGVLTLSTWPAY